MNGIYEHPLYLARWQDRFRCPLPIKLNPYLGCTGGCSYCFAVQMRKPNQPDRSKSLWPGSVDFLRDKLDESLNGNKNKSYLHECLRQKIPIQIGVLTDPFQPVERLFRVTYQMIELLYDYDYPFMLITKFNVPKDCLELLGDCDCVVHVSLSSLDPEFINKTEKNTPSPRERLKNMKQLYQCDVQIQHRFWPVWPLLTDEPGELFESVSNMGCSDTIVSYIRLFNYKRFMPRINKSLGFDYLKYLEKNDYPIVKEHDYYRVHPDHMLKEYYRFQGLAEREELGFYTPDMLGFNDGDGCCGTDHVIGIGAGWSLNMNTHVFNNETTFNNYMKNHNCPYKEQFKRYWNNNGIVKAFNDIKLINEKKMSYKRR